MLVITLDKKRELKHPAMSDWIYFYIANRAIGIMVPMFANGAGDRGSIPGQVIPKSQK